MREVTVYESDDGSQFGTSEECLKYESQFKGEIFDFPMQENAACADTIGDYFRALLATLWEEGDSFSGKRPFGNSGWQWELYETLVKAKAITGEFNDYQELVECDDAEGNRIIAEAIEKFGLTTE